MAEIVKARDTGRSGEPIVAVKRILPHLTDDRQFVTMFLDESRVLAQLEHEKIIHAYEIGDVDGAPYIALEYVYGQDARVLFHRSRRNEENVPVAIACFIIAEVCDALHYAHERTDSDGSVLGVVHRDVSLQNILLSYDGEVKLTDFGIAMSVENRARTEAGIVKGKFGYMSPEQIRGESLDRRSDVFAAGICLYELLTSERLFSGDSDYAAVERVRNVDIQLPSVFNRQIPSALESIVMKALARHPRDRFQTANDLRRALLSFMTESHNEASARDLSEHMRALFAEEIRKQPTPGTLVSDAARQADEGTGLAAFDDLDPVSALSALNPEPVVPAAVAPAAAPSPPSFEAEHAVAPHRFPSGAPSVPPVVPRPDSIPGNVPASDVFPRGADAVAAGFAQGPAPPRIDMDWEDEDDVPTDMGQLEDPYAEIGDDDVTRQIRVGETFAGAGVVGSGIRSSGPPLQQGAPAPFPPRSDAPPGLSAPPGAAASVAPGHAISPSGAPAVSVEEAPGPAPAKLTSRSYAVAVGVVAGIIVLISAGLYLTKAPDPGVIQLATAPADVEVRVDGTKITASRSPFVVPDLEPNEQHRIEVRRDGYTSWSSRLTVRPGQTLELPRVTLEPIEELEAGAGAEAEAGELAASRGDSTGEATAKAKADVNEPKRRRRAAEPEREAKQEALADSKAQARTKAKRRSTRDRTRAKRIRAKRRATRQTETAAAPSLGFGTLRINSRPWSQVIVDGRKVGNTPQMNVRLSAGKHTVTLVNPQFNVRKTLRIRVRAGQTLTKVVDLM